jgi:intracellular sulfur oxidation DsrE/DsrF family protein
MAAGAAQGLLIHAYGAEDSDALATALRAARGSRKELGPGPEIQIIVQGPAVRLLTVGSTYAEELDSTSQDSTIEIFACQNSMRSAEVDQADLLPVSGSVPSAVAHLAQQQWNGWAYVRF